LPYYLHEHFNPSRYDKIIVLRSRLIRSAVSSPFFTFVYYNLPFHDSEKCVLVMQEIILLRFHTYYHVWSFYKFKESMTKIVVWVDLYVTDTSSSNSVGQFKSHGNAVSAQVCDNLLLQAQFTQSEIPISINCLVVTVLYALEYASWTNSDIATRVARQLANREKLT